jgi:UPF0716 protein FxsA
MVRRWLLTLIVLVLLDWVLLGILACYVSWQVTLAAILGPSLLGIVVLRLVVPWRWRRPGGPRYARGNLLGGMLDIMLIAAGGVLLVIPGLLTDLVGLLLLTPARRLAHMLIASRLDRVAAALHARYQGNDADPRTDDRIIDVRLIEPKEPKACR